MEICWFGATSIRAEVADYAKYNGESGWPAKPFTSQDPWGAIFPLLKN
jgi:hypothetical protein